MLKVIVRKVGRNHVEFCPGEYYVDELFNILFNKLEYSVKDRLAKGSESDESGYEGYIKVELRVGETYDKLINDLKSALPVIPKIEITPEGCILYLTRAYL